MKQKKKKEKRKEIRVSMFSLFCINTRTRITADLQVYLLPKNLNKEKTNQKNIKKKIEKNSQRRIRRRRRRSEQPEIRKKKRELLMKW